MVYSEDTVQWKLLGGLIEIRVSKQSYAGFAESSKSFSFEECLFFSDDFFGISTLYLL